MEARLGDPAPSARFSPRRPFRRAEGGKTDSTDVAILRALAHPVHFQWDVRVSNADVARAVGLDEETVRTRLRRLQERGVLRGFTVGVHPGVLGRELVRAQTPPLPEETRGKARDALAAIDGAALLFDYYGGAVGLVLYAPRGGPHDRLRDFLAALAGPPTALSVLRLPEATVELDATDWRVVAALRRDPRRPLETLAAEAGIAERTLRRRLERLTAGRAVYLETDVDMGRAEGIVPTTLLVEHADPARRAAVDARLQAIPDLVFRSFEDRVSRVSFQARSLTALEALRAEVAAMPGVAAVRADMMLARTLCPRWLDEEVARRAGAP